MSLKTWKKEFYPRTTRGIKTRAAAISHSLRKWTGLTSGGLKRHKVYIKDRALIDDEYGSIFEIDADSCALCKLYADEACKGCPLFILRGAPCDEPIQGDGLPPWQLFGVQGNPNKMLNLLQKASLIPEKGWPDEAD